ncbi:MAG: response regulator [Nitrososphaerales archaeon]
MEFKAARRKLEIVLVANSPRLINVYEKFFAIAGLKIIKKFSDTKDLISYFKTNDMARDSIVLIDINQSEMDGVEVAEQINLHYPEQKLILATARDSSEIDSSQKLYDGIIHKPFTISELLATIENASSPMRMKGSWIFDISDGIDHVLREILSDSKERLCSVRSPSSIAKGRASGRPPPYIEAREKGLEVMLITEVNKENLFYCKELIVNQGVKLRHLDELEFSFGIWDRKHTIEVVVSSDKIFPSGVVLYSNLEHIVSKNQYMFDHLWSLSKPGEEKIRELESKNKQIGEIKTISGEEENLKARLRLIKNAHYMLDAHYDSQIALRLRSSQIVEAYSAAWKSGVKLRHITEITKENLRVCKEFIQIGIELRHLSGIVGGFAVNDTEFDAKMSKDSGSDMESMYSNYPEFVEQHKSIFNTLWSIAIPVSTRIKEIELEQKQEKEIRNNQT